MICRLIVNPHNDKLWDGVIAQYMIGRSLHQHQRGQGSKPIHPRIFQVLLINYCILKVVYKNCEDHIQYFKLPVTLHSNTQISCTNII